MLRYRHNEQTRHHHTTHPPRAIRKEVCCYLALLGSGALSVSEIAEQMKILPNAVYRLIAKLETYQMIVSLGTSPKKYQAIPSKAALENLVNQQTTALEESKHKALSSLAGHADKADTKIDFITGQKQFFDTFVKLSVQAKQEILVISIGEAVSDSIKLATRDALAKGVDCKFMFHKYDDNNTSLLKSWVAMGVNVAYYPDSGFHLLVFDGKKAVLVSSNPQETNERSGMIISSPSLANAMREFFYARWNKATPIKK